MTYISKLISKKLGGLDTKILELKPGLNVVYGPNEAGKSTWAALIKLIFYGWGNKKQDKQEYTKFCKDAGLSISVVMDDYKGKRLLIERVKKDSCNAFYEQDGKVCPDLTGAAPGEILFGVDRETFEKTTYIKQLSIPTSKSEIIESKISAIISTGDAEGAVSYKEAYSALDELAKKIGGQRRNSKIVILEEEIYYLKEMLEENRQNLINLNDKKFELNIINEEYAKNQKLLKELQAYKSKELLEKVLQLERLARSHELKAEAIGELITKGDILPDEEFINCSEIRLRQCENSFLYVETQKLELVTLQNDLKEFESVLLKFDFFESLDYESNNAEILRIADKIEELSNEKVRINKLQIQINDLKDKYEVVKSKIAEKRKLENNSIGKLLWGFSAMIFSILILFLYLNLIIPVFVTFTALVFCIFGAIIKGKNKYLNPQLEEEKIRIDAQLSYVQSQVISFNNQDFLSYCSQLKDFMDLIDCRDIDSYKKKKHLYLLYKNEHNQIKERVNKGRVRLEQKMSEYKDHLETFEKYTKGYFSEGLSITLMKSELESLRRQVFEIRALTLQKENVKARLGALLGDVDIESLKALSIDSPDYIDTSKANIVEAQTVQIQQNVIALGIVVAKLETLVSTNGMGLDAIESEIIEKIDMLEEYKLKEKASKLALDILSEAYENYSSRYAPELALGTGKMFEYLSNGHYNHVSMDSDFKLIATNTNQSRFDQDKLSAGASEQLWLALRITLSSLIYRNSDVQPPFILDDTFVNFDDERCQRGLDLLIKMSKERQVILFTCHSREVEYLRNNLDVHITEYDKKWAI